MDEGRKRVAATLLTVGLTLLGGGTVVGLKTMEGKENVAYVDRLPTIPVVTVCYGHTATAKLGQYYTDAECDALLIRDLNTIYAPGIRRCLTAPVTQNEFNALVDFGYNLGIAKACGSTLMKLVNRGQYDLASNEFTKWTFVGGKDCKLAASRCSGIVKRREWEQRMFRTP